MAKTTKAVRTSGKKRARATKSAKPTANPPTLEMHPRLKQQAFSATRLHPFRRISMRYTTVDFAQPVELLPQRHQLKPPVIAGSPMRSKMSTFITIPLHNCPTLSLPNEQRRGYQTSAGARRHSRRRSHRVHP